MGAFWGQISPAEWVVAGGAVIAGLGGGVIGALISNGGALRMARDSRRAEAARALWDFQRALRDFEAELDDELFQDGDLFTSTPRQIVAEKRETAYPFAVYLPKDKQMLVRRNFIGSGLRDRGDPMGPLEEVAQWASDLEKALAEAFPGPEN